MRLDIAPGNPFPDYELPDHESVPRNLSEIQGDEPMILHTLVLKPGLTIHKIYNGYVLAPPARPSFADLWRDLREAWDCGDHSPFHGWNRRAQAGAAS